MFKMLATSALLAASSATPLFAADYIVDNDRNRESCSAIIIDTVRADNGGVLEIYEYHGGEMGDLLGSQELSPGANADVHVMLDRAACQDILAVLRVNGEILDTYEIEID